ncbi:MAG TPA: 3-oxoadipate enol-lactonase [Bosea sp. (in: a-proteobacteria)]|jgi:3-oxoadipate enol-lactonase|uniref:3-oxoadipate enol-lactonase n=1 Tax=Bosea sp. (in: a-proteobacteria) TaxID=1871050 RepID=UPI002E0DA781|nr:3-oxoadipate enol-lactonase [Bosea sp. (in: a-proteobacteria)]
MPMLKVRGEDFHIRIDGDERAPVLLLSNSLGTNLSMWDPQIPEWSKHFRIVRYDSRGHGLSPAPDKPYSIAMLADDALAILDTLGIDKAHWCGLSKGGMVGQWLATHHGDRLGRVVLANTAARMGPPELWDGRIDTVRKHGMSVLVQPTLERWFTPEFRDSAKETVAKVSEMLATTPPLGYANCCGAIRDMDQRETIRAVRNPVLVVIGARDPATPPATGYEIADAIPGAQRIELAAAHLSNLEQPEAFGRAVTDFLKG